MDYLDKRPVKWTRSATINTKPLKRNISVKLTSWIQVRSAILDSILAKTKNNNLEPFPKSIFLQSHWIFDNDSSTKVNFETSKVKDFYRLLNKKVNVGPHTGPTNGVNSCQYVRNNGKKIYIN